MWSPGSDVSLTVFLSRRHSFIRVCDSLPYDVIVLVPKITKHLSNWPRFAIQWHGFICGRSVKAVAHLSLVEEMQFIHSTGGAINHQLNQLLLNCSPFAQEEEVWCEKIFERAMKPCSGGTEGMIIPQKWSRDEMSDSELLLLRTSIYISAADPSKYVIPGYLFGY